MRYCANSITAKEHAELFEVAVPEVLGPNEIRGRTLCTLVSPGTEPACNYTGTSFPSFPGYAAVFVAEEIGAEVQGVCEGDVRFCMGSHRSFQQVDAQSARVIPAGLQPEKAVLDAWQVVRKRGELVLVGVPWRRQTGIPPKP